MPIIVECPSCAGQLRVADSLIGRKVRCPACNATFDSPREQSAEAPPAIPPIQDLSLDSVSQQSEAKEVWKSLDLELKPDPVEPTPDPVEPTSNPLPRETPPPLHPPKSSSSKPEAASRQEAASRPRAKLSDAHDDLTSCPECGRTVHRDARRCIACGERLSPNRYAVDDDYPRSEMRFRKFDCEPHRGGLILTMGIISLVLPFLCLAIIGWVPGLLAWIMGGSDLKRMRSGDIDPEGFGSTQAGWVCGIIGTLLNGMLVLVCGGMIGLAWIGQLQATKAQQQMRQQPFNPPPALPK